MTRFLSLAVAVATLSCGAVAPGSHELLSDEAEAACQEYLGSKCPRGAIEGNSWVYLHNGDAEECGDPNAYHSGLMVWFDRCDRGICCEGSGCASFEALTCSTSADCPSPYFECRER